MSHPFIADVSPYIADDSPYFTDDKPYLADDNPYIADKPSLQAADIKEEFAVFWL